MHVQVVCDKVVYAAAAAALHEVVYDVALQCTLYYETVRVRVGQDMSQCERQKRQGQTKQRRIRVRIRGAPEMMRHWANVPYSYWQA